MIFSVLALAAAAVGGPPRPPDVPGPMIFERAPGPNLPIIGASDFERHFPQSLSVSANGDYVALGRGPGVVEVWATDSGKETATLQPMATGYVRSRYARAVVAGSPCVAVAGVTGMVLQSGTPVATEVPEVGFWTCATGEKIGTLPAEITEGSRGLGSLTAVPSCGLVVAVFARNVAVIDLATRAPVPALGKMFDDVRSAAFPPHPNDKQARKGVRLNLGMSSADDGCVVYGALHENTAPGGRLAAKAYAFDLRAGRARFISALSMTVPNNDPEVAVTRFVVSPARRYAALSAGPRGGSFGTSIAFVDLAGKEPTTFFDKPDGEDITDLAFLDEDTLLLTTEYQAQNTDALLLDRRSMRLHTYCWTTFGETHIEVGNPRAIAVNAKLNLLAVALQNDVRLFHYRPNPAWNGKWSVRDCVVD